MAAKYRQQTLFSKNTIQSIKIYNQAAVQESKTGGDMNVKFSPTQKQAIHSLAAEYGLKDSQFVREMVDLAIKMFPYRERIQRHESLLLNLLSNLP